MKVQQHKKTNTFSFLTLVIGCFLFSISSATFAQTIPAVEFQNQLKTDNKAVLLDVRTSEEYNSGHLEQAKNLNIYDQSFKEELSKMDKTQPVYVYCKGGGRSANAVKQMQELGFTSVYELKGGIMAWEQGGLPLSNAEKPKTDRFTSTDFDKMLKANKNVLVDFYAEWCLPCKQMEPVLEKLKNQFKGKVSIERVNVDEAKSLSKSIKIEGLPVVAIYQNGVEIKRVTGFQSEKDLLKLIQQLK
ncbi:thioredoxin domain-containing protein [Pedobacter gandavensis]|uniref:Thioredoxin fold domain-containing protein n=1 Tax=Pedobacter gandavensis TaxID=2679963 RepID=A0ABR6ESC0_9SPHI|nr:thioredoxin domain-containing protein [Pedobacter gandavensis]MBB2148157.1 thioredoxin fold domain-containing protein [Pedobacter gandavensis]